MLHEKRVRVVPLGGGAATAEETIGRVIGFLEIKLDGYLSTFITYPDADKRHSRHEAFVTFINRAREYRSKYPRQHKHEATKKAIEKVFRYAEQEQKRLKAE